MWCAIATFFFFRDFQQKSVFAHGSGICVITTKRPRAARCSRGSAVPVPMETGLEYCLPLTGAPSREPFVLDELSSTTFQQQTLQLPPDSFLIEMQINLCGWLHFPYSLWQVQLYPEFRDFPTSDFSCHCWQDAASTPQHHAGQNRDQSLQVLHTLPLLQHQHHGHSTPYPHWTTDTRQSVWSICNHTGVQTSSATDP